MLTASRQYPNYCAHAWLITAHAFVRLDENSKFGKNALKVWSAFTGSEVCDLGSLELIQTLLWRAVLESYCVRVATECTFCWRRFKVDSHHPKNPIETFESANWCKRCTKPRSCRYESSRLAIAEILLCGCWMADIKSLKYFYHFYSNSSVP